MQSLSVPSPKSLVSPAWLRRQMRETGLAQSTEVPFESFEHFCSLIQIRPKTGHAFYFRPETWHTEQKQFQRDRTGRDIVLKGRQVGFSTLELARDLYYALVNP